MQKVQENSCQSCKKVTIFGENIHLDKFHPYISYISSSYYRDRHVTVSQDMNGCLSDRTMSPCQSLWIYRKYPLSKMINMTIGDDDDGVLIKGNMTISNRKLQH